MNAIRLLAFVVFLITDRPPPGLTRQPMIVTRWNADTFQRTLLPPEVGPASQGYSAMSASVNQEEARRPDY